MTAADAPAVAALHAASWRSAYRGLLPDSFLDSDLLANRQALWQARWQQPESPEAFGLVACDGDTLIGFAYALPAHDDQWGTLLDNLHVVPARKGAGVGRRLLQAVVAGLGAHVSRPLHLWVLEGNLPARAFYARLGGEEVERLLCPPFAGVELPEWRCVWRDPRTLMARPESPA